jgi:hypothetical protein
MGKNDQNAQIEIRRIEDFIKTLGEKELRYVNRLVIERLKLVHQEKSTAQMKRFNIGERVEFTTPHGVKKKGLIVKLNKKTASIHTDDHEHWNVAPGLLKTSS